MTTDASVHNVKRVFSPKHLDTLRAGDKVQMGKTVFLYGGKSELGRYESASYSFFGIDNGDLVVMKAGREAFVPDRKDGTITPAPRYVNIQRHRQNSLEFRAYAEDLRRAGLN